MVAWLASLLFFAAFYALLIPLPLLLEARGLRDDQIGLILGGFAVAALLGRPFAGWATDRIGPRVMLLSGALALMIGTLGMLSARAVALLFALRALQALGYVAFTTASTVLIVHLANPARRNTTLARFGIAANVAMTLVPALVGAALPWLAYQGAFWLAAGLALGALLLVHLVLLPGLPIHTQPSTVAAPRFAWGGLLIPMLAALLMGVGFGAFLQFLPLLATRRGSLDPGLFYTTYGLAIIGTRLLGGGWLDRLAQAHVLAGGFIALGLGLLLFGVVLEWSLLLLATVLIAIGNGLLHPILISMHIAALPSTARGQATAAFYVAFDLGIGGGAWVLGLVLAWAGLTWLYVVAALASILGSMLAWQGRSAEAMLET